MCNITLWDPKRLQWDYNKIEKNKMKRNILQGKVVNIGELTAVNPLCGADKVLVTPTLNPSMINTHFHVITSLFHPRLDRP
jgi:cytosine/adenosine deaminase-related metal-dependent hydrolase